MDAVLAFWRLQCTGDLYGLSPMNEKKVDSAYEKIALESGSRASLESSGSQ